MVIKRWFIASGFEDLGWRYIEIAGSYRFVNRQVRVDKQGSIILTGAVEASEHNLLSEALTIAEKVLELGTKI